MKFEDMMNNIILGDSYDLIKNIPDKSIDLVYIDIPYLYDDYSGGGLLKNETRKATWESMKSIINGIDYSIFNELCRVMKNVYIYIWCSRLQILDIMNWFNEKYDVSIDILCWCKKNPIPFTNNTFLSDIEYCLCIRELKKTKLNDGMELKSKWYLSAINQSDKKMFCHPTIKPLELIKRHILHSTQENDIVLDCFCGSGTTCVACKELNRRFIGIEIDEKYHKIACDRLNGISANGQMSIFTNFDEMSD